MASSYILVVLIALCYVTQLGQAANQGATKKKPKTSKEAKCGHGPEWSPCVPLSDANKRFEMCCRDYNLPGGCVKLCKYSTTVAQVQAAAKNNQCGLNNLIDYLYCASQNRNNKNCCSGIGLDKSAGSHCLRYCNPSDGIAPSRNDLSCAAHLEWILRCHWVGLR